jgi:hypothetical protein
VRRPPIPIFGASRTPAHRQAGGIMGSRPNKFSAFSPRRGEMDRSLEWWNQNQFDCSKISKRIWKKRLKRPSATSIAWPPFPNEAAFGVE